MGKSRSARARAARLGIYACATVLAALWFAPIWFSLSIADKSNSEYLKESLWAPPKAFALFHNIAAAWGASGLGQGFVNSLIYGVVGAGLAVLLASLACYGLVVLRPKRRLFWFIVIFSGTVLPPQLYLIPVYRMYQTIGLYNTRVGLIMFYMAWAVPFATLVMRGYFSTIPEELVGAARLDGASEFRIFRSIYLPMSVAALTVVFLFQFTAIWNDLLFGLVLTSSSSVRPVMPSLFSLFGVYSSSATPVVLAGALVAAGPTIVLFFALQKYFMRGIVMTFGR